MSEKKTITPDLSITVHRIDSGTVELCWQPGDRKSSVTVCSGLHRKDAMRKIPISNCDNGCVRISGLDPAVRYYYHVVDEDGSRFVTAERQIFLEGAVNFRDIGGYKTEDGREVKWGKIFRSDGLSRLTARDIRLIRHMGISRVFDFRTPAEINAAPDRLPEDGSVTHINLPVTHGKFDFVDAMKRLKKGDVSWLTPDFMVNGYIRNLEAFGGVWGEVINAMADLKDKALLFHCTGGKDRTGVCAALFLLMLGVDEETVIRDHQLSNEYIAGILPRVFELIASYGVDPEKIVPYITAPIECIHAFLDHLRAYYGSAADYLADRAGVKKETQEQLQETLLR